jgi:type II secretory pathway pseudopilin PulG
MLRRISCTKISTRLITDNKTARPSAQIGLTIIEMLVAVAIFAVLITGVIGLYGILVKSVKAVRQQTILSNLAASQSEIMRNLPYSQIGTLSGNPSGSLADSSNPIVSVIEGTTFNTYFEVTYVDDPADGTILAGTDAAPNDYKQVKMSIQNMASSQITDFVTTATPKGLEGLTNAGALYIQVINAQGQPVPSAAVHIQNTAGTIILNRTADAAGNWIEVGLPAGVNIYHISVTKAGYSTDQTYPITVGNPNPIKPDSTIVNGQVTQISFAIDTLSNLTVRTLNSICAATSGVDLNIKGAKLIGTNPDVLKFNNNYTSASGQVVLNSTEWDSYIPALLTGQSVMILGTSPIQQINVLPGANATYTMILGAKTANSLLVIVKDASNGTALEGANVHLALGGATPADYYGITGGSVWNQSSWTGGSGQVNFVNANQYFADDGNVDTAAIPTGLRLKKIGSDYVASGQLVSSTFDTGGSSNFTTITWQPTSQNASTALRFQIATNSDNATWNYLGPDGTAGTFYTVSGSNIAPVHDNDRYMRYKVYLDSTDNQQTPVLSNVAINYVAGCFTPGQVSFPGLTASNNYTLTITMPGYQDSVTSGLNISGNQSIQLQMSP